MSLRDVRNNYYHIPKTHDHKTINSDKLQSDVEAFKAAGGKIEVVPLGVSKFMSDLDKARHQRKYGRHGK